MSEFNLSEHIEENHQDIMDEFELKENQRCWIYTKHIKEFIKLLEKEYKSALCRTGFTDNSNDNKRIRYEAFDQFEEVLLNLAGSRLTEGK